MNTQDAAATWKEVVAAVQSGRNADYHRTGGDGGRDLLRRATPQERAQRSTVPIEHVIEMVDAAAHVMEGYEGKTLGEKRGAMLGKGMAALQNLQAMGYTKDDIRDLVATLHNPVLRNEFIQGQQDWQMRQKRMPRGPVITNGREQILLEPIEGVYDQFRDELRRYRQFHIAEDQFGDFMERDGKGEELVAVAPFETFSLISDHFIDGKDVTPSSWVPRDARVPKESISRCEGITCTLLPEEMGNAWRVITAWHLSTEYWDKHVVSVAMIGEVSPGNGGSMRPYGEMPSGVRVLEVPVPRDERVTDEGYKEQKDTARRISMLGHQVLLRFLHTLNHRSVRIIETSDPARPVSRPLRKAEGYVERPHYTIYIPANITYRKVADEARAGKNMKAAPKGYDRRGHLRRDQQGRKRIVVRPHYVPGKTGEWSPYKIYSAHNVGLGGVDDAD